MREVPFMISILKTEELESFKETMYSRYLENELDILIREEKITSLQKELVIAIKAGEYYSFCVKGNAWRSVKYYLEHFPEIFKIHDLLLIDEPVKKFFYIINSHKEGEFEKILKFQGLNYEKHQRNLNDGRVISIYTGFLFNPKQYSFNVNPVLKAFKIAEDAGIRIGFHYYQGKEEMYSAFSLALIRSFPIDSDKFGDFSKADGGFREDLNAGFKSSWEANIARLLNEKNLNWKYEGVSFGTEIGGYFPDFIIRHDDKTYILEVKGHWDGRSVKKVWSAITQIKDGKLIIIDSDYYSLLDEKFGNIIPNWEGTKAASGSFDIPVIGLTVGKRLTTIQALVEGEQLKLLREPDNPYDSNAIKVVTNDDREVGYIAKDWASIFAYKMDCGFTYKVSLKQKELNKKRVMVKLFTEPAALELLKKIDFL